MGFEMPAYELPVLPYDYDALEPSIDSRIMELHHDRHHQGYVDGANAALDRLEEMRDSGDFSGIKAVKRNLSFHTSGHANHSMFWETGDAAMGPTVQQDENGTERYVRPPFSFSVDDEAIRRGWTDFDVGQLSGVAPYHGMVYLDRSDSIHELMRPLQRLEPTRR